MRNLRLLIRYIALIGIGLLIAACTRTEVLKLPAGNEVAVECLPVYGNWCGEGYPAYLKTGFIPDPVDVWDQACQRHDLCYDGVGNYTKEACDADFSDQIKELYDKGYPVPRAINAAYAFYKQEVVYHNNAVTLADLDPAVKYTCRGGDGRPALFCDVGMGRDDCEINTNYYLETGKCFCDYSPDIWSEATRKWGSSVYSATR